LFSLLYVKELLQSSKRYKRCFDDNQDSLADSKQAKVGKPIAGRLSNFARRARALFSTLIGEADVQIVIAIDDDRLGRTPLLVIDPATVIDIGEPETLSG
jgi:hypothetical protein